MQQKLKRIMDVVVSSAVLFATAPISFAVALIIRINMGSPVLFRHRRPGLNEEIFTLYKFRTMTYERDEEGELLPNEQRLTAAGRTIRRLSLDELPQLWNVLKGDMSLVGPRPLLVEYLECYSDEQRRRHEVRPGITGWAQINGRNAISWEKKFELDIWYVNNRSFLLDLKIMVVTLYKILKRDSITPNHGETMQKFTGSQKDYYEPSN